MSGDESLYSPADDAASGRNVAEVFDLPKSSVLGGDFSAGHALVLSVSPLNYQLRHEPGDLLGHHCAPEPLSQQGQRCVHGTLAMGLHFKQAR